MPQNNNELYIWSSDQSYIYYYYDGSYNYPIRGKELGENPAYSPGEIFISSGTNNIRWRSTSGNMVYQAKGVGVGSISGKTNQELYVNPSDASLNLVRDNNRNIISTNVIINNSEPGDLASDPYNIMLVLDKSGSMSNTISGSTSRMAALKTSVSQLMNVLPNNPEDNPDLNIGLIEFRDCTAQSVSVPLSGVDKQAIVQRVNQMVPLGQTPIVAALEAALSAINGAAGTRIILLVTDGGETCGGSLTTVATAIQTAGVELRIVGIDLLSSVQLQLQPHASFFENALTASGLTASVQRSLGQTSIGTVLSAYVDPARTQNALIGGEIAPGTSSRTTRHRDIVYCRLGGLGEDKHDFTIPDMRSGYSYLVEYSYGASVGASYSCSNSYTTDNGRTSIPATYTCSGDVGQIGRVCNYTFMGSYWSSIAMSGSGVTDSALCSSANHVGNKRSEYGWVSSSGCLSGDTRVTSLGTCNYSGRGTRVCLTGSTSYKVEFCACSSVGWTAPVENSSCVVNNNTCSSCDDVGKVNCYQAAKVYTCATTSTSSPKWISQDGLDVRTQFDSPGPTWTFCGCRRTIQRVYTVNCDSNRTLFPHASGVSLSSTFTSAVGTCPDYSSIDSYSANCFPGGTFDPSGSYTRSLTSKEYYGTNSSSGKYTRTCVATSVAKHTVVESTVSVQGFIPITSSCTNPQYDANKYIVTKNSTSSSLEQSYVCSETARYQCRGDFRVFACTGDEGVASSWGNVTVTEL